MTTCNAQAYNRCENFNPTLLLREVTSIFGYFKITDTISIHTSLTGSDCVPKFHVKIKARFQSTLPSREVTQPDFINRFCYVRFQSTLPSREVTMIPTPPTNYQKISIHTSLTGSDNIRQTLSSRKLISIHTSLTGSD